MIWKRLKGNLKSLAKGERSQAELLRHETLVGALSDDYLERVFIFISFNGYFRLLNWDI